MAQVYEWNFEEDNLQGLLIENATITTGSSLVINGQGSLFADSRETQEGWNEFLLTNPETIKFKPNTAYTIQMEYRGLEPLGVDNFYLLFRSESAGQPDGDRWGGYWKTWDQEVHTKKFIVRTGDAADYYLIIGIREQGALVIDDLRIHAGSSPQQGQLITRPFVFEDEWKSWQDTGRENGLADWLKVVQLVIDPAGWRYKGNQDDLEYLLTVSQDISAYVDNEVVRRLGLTRARMSMEYQEMYEGDARRNNVSWEAFAARFTDEGIAIGLDGEPIIDQTWAAGGVFTCHSGQGWHDYFLEDLKKNYESWEGLNQDNIGVVGAFKGHGVFCPGCQQSFREMLLKNYDRETLKAWGIENPETFDIRLFLLNHSLSGPTALASPLVREYIKNYYKQQIHAWQNIVKQLRNWTAEFAVPYVIYGNNIGAMGPSPYAVALCPWVDVVSMEHWYSCAKFYEPPRFHVASWGYKVASAAAGYQKPILILNALEGGEHGASLDRTIVELTMAEGLANGGYRVFSPGANIASYQGPQPLEVPEIRTAHLDYARFIRNYRGIFWGRQSAHRTAVVYSIPTHMFHNFPPIPELQEIDDYKRFSAACLMLEHAGIPYDVVVFPHPEIMPDLQGAGLEDYDFVVLPGVVALSSDQAKSIEQVLERDGQVLAFEPFAKVDENYNPRDDIFPTRDQSGLLVLENFDLQIGLSAWNRTSYDQQTQAIQSALNQRYPSEKRQVIGNLRDTLSINLWEDEEEKFFSTHIVNYDWDPEHDQIRAATGLEIGVLLPEKYTTKPLYWVTPESDQPSEVSYQHADGRAWIAVPPVRAYGVLVWGELEPIQAKTLYAETLHLGRRLAVLGLQEESDWQARLVNAWQTDNQTEIEQRFQNYRKVIAKIEQELRDNIPSP